MGKARTDRLREIARVAALSTLDTAFPPELLIAQWAVESAWGTRRIGRNNVFGIKCAARHDVCFEVETHEVVKGKRVRLVQRFADYPSLTAACIDYLSLLTQRGAYREEWLSYLGDQDFEAFVRGVAKVYATDPNYADLVLTIARQRNVAVALKLAREAIERGGV